MQSIDNTFTQFYRAALRNAVSVSQRDYEKSLMLGQPTDQQDIRLLNKELIRQYSTANLIEVDALRDFHCILVFEYCHLVLDLTSSLDDQCDTQDELATLLGKTLKDWKSLEIIRIRQMLELISTREDVAGFTQLTDHLACLFKLVQALHAFTVSPAKQSAKALDGIYLDVQKTEKDLTMVLSVSAETSGASLQ